jgi:hypothetical protein
MRAIPLTTLIIAAAVAISCTERPGPTAAGSRPSFDFINGPASPGNSGLFRFQDVEGTFAVDVNAGLISIHGLQNTLADFCIGLGQFDIMDFQIKPQSTGDVNSLLLDRSSSVQIVPLVPFNCAALSGAPVLYRGTASFHRTDNNFTLTPEGQRTNSFGWTSEGVLDDLVNGGQVRYSEEVRRLLTPSGDFTVPVSRINVIPIQ